MRAALSALGIAIGVAAIVAVLGLSSSSQAGLLAADRQARHEPAHRPERADAVRTDGRAAARRAGDDLAHRPGAAGAVHRLDERERLPQPAHPVRQHERALGAGGEPRPAGDGRSHGRRRRVPQRGHRARAGRRARLRGRAAARHRPPLPGRAHLAGRDVVLPRRHPQLRDARARDRRLRPRRLPGRASATSASTATRPPSTSAR